MSQATSRITIRIFYPLSSDTPAAPPPVSARIPAERAAGDQQGVSWERRWRREVLAGGAVGRARRIAALLCCVALLAALAFVIAAAYEPRRSSTAASRWRDGDRAPRDARPSTAKGLRDSAGGAAAAGVRPGFYPGEGIAFSERSAPQAGAQGLAASVARMQLTSGMRGREPRDAIGAKVTGNVGGRRELYCFSELRGLEGQTVTHRWEHAGQVVAQVRFRIGADRWRVFSSKILSPTQVGTWRVVVLDERGRALRELTFDYRPRDPAV